jgi:hypothetical protein
MLDGLLWKPLHTKPTFTADGELQWLVLERHRLTGATRTTRPYHPEVRAEDFARIGRETATDGGSKPSESIESEDR